jgi:hypothetical protein
VEQLPEVVNRFSDDRDLMLQRINPIENAIRNRFKKLKVNKAL